MCECDHSPSTLHYTTMMTGSRDENRRCRARHSRDHRWWGRSQRQQAQTTATSIHSTYPPSTLFSFIQILFFLTSIFSSSSCPQIRGNREPLSDNRLLFLADVAILVTQEENQNHRSVISLHLIISHKTSSS